MKAFIAKSAWVEEEGLRLDAKGYAEGALAARSNILEGPWPWFPLEKVARLFRGPLHKRYFIRNPARSIPYLAASDVTKADLPRDMRLSIALTSVLPILKVESGWTLISSAGTIGDTTYVREELTEYAISQDMLRVAPFKNILSGYLFAYLSTRGAQALLRFRTYGSVVDRIEPKHIADLPVPLLAPTQQQNIHNLVVSASQARTDANKLLKDVAEYFNSLVGPMTSTHDHVRTITLIKSSQLDYRFEARVRSGDIAIQGSGQRYGLLGRPAYIGKRLDGWASSHDLFRIRASNITSTARIYAFLRSDSGHRAMLRHSYGTSIPHVNPEGIASVRVPVLPDFLVVKATRALQLIEQADADEEQAIREVEQWVNSLH